MYDSWVCCRLEKFLNDEYQRLGYMDFVLNVFPVVSGILAAINLRMVYGNAREGIRVVRR